MTQKLTINERTELVLMCARVGATCRSVADEFNTKYPDRSPVHFSTVSRLFERFKASGSVLDSDRSGRPRSSTNESTTQTVLSTLENDPMLSIRDLETLTSVKRSSIYNILKKEKFIPYKIKYVHELKETDAPKRLLLSRWLSEISPNGIFFSDECLFSVNNRMNKQNKRLWAKERPNWVTTHGGQNSPKVMVWIAISGTRLIGPYFFRGNVTKNSYLEMLQTCFVPNIRDLLMEKDEEIMFQQDGASAHYADIVKEYLNQIFPEKWIGRGGPIEWPPRSPDLNPLDFFLWGFLKSIVYTVEPPQNQQELEDRIENACKMVTPEMLWNVQNELRRRVNKCVEMRGQQFEHLLN
jgi:transposase